MLNEGCYEFFNLGFYKLQSAKLHISSYYFSLLWHGYTLDLGSSLSYA